MKKRLQLIPVHPFLFVAYFFAFLYANNLGRVDAMTLARPLGLTMAVVAVLYLALSRGTRDVRRAALVVSLLVVLMFTYGHAFGWLYAQLRVTALMLHLLVTQLFLVVLLVGQWAIRRARDLAHASRAAHLMAGMLLLMVAWPVLAFHLRGEVDHAPLAAGSVSAQEEIGGDAPDIYLIVLDSYARHDILEKHYDFGNRAMLDSLLALGFHVAPESRSNYAWTDLSIPSLLNMRYLDELASGRREHGLAPRRAEALTRKNQVVKLLRSRGYRYIHFNSTIGGTRNNPFADEEVRCRGSIFHDESYRALMESSWLRLLDFAAANDLARCHLSQFEQLANAAARQSPKFVFAHFVPPHHPYLFDRSGRVLRRATLANQMQYQDNLWADRDGYLEQLLFVNDRVLDVIGRILEGSEAEPVIVLLSDHGPHLPGAERSTYFQARFANLTALHLPRGARTEAVSIAADITPVNIFRLVLDYYLGFELPALPNRHFFSTFDDPYAFVDVTRELSERANALESEGDADSGSP